MVTRRAEGPPAPAPIPPLSPAKVVAQWSPPAAGATRGDLDARVALRAESSDDRFSDIDALLIFCSLRFGGFLEANPPLLHLVFRRTTSGRLATVREVLEVIARSEALRQGDG